jgi:hypothetical protein
MFKRVKKVEDFIRRPHSIPSTVSHLANDFCFLEPTKDAAGGLLRYVKAACGCLCTDDRTLHDDIYESFVC